MNRNTQLHSPTLSRTSTAVGAGERLRFIFRCIPARIGVAIASPILFLTSLVMLIVGIMVARILANDLLKLQRLATYLQIANYALVLVIAIIGLVAAIRPSLRVAQVFTGFLVAQFPFGVVAGALAMRLIFKGIQEAKTSIVDDSTTFTDICSASLQDLSFLCQWVQTVKPIIVLSFLEFWIWELFTIYAGVVYCRQLSSMGDIKVLEEEDA